MKKILVVIDMQNDFIDGSLGTTEAVKIIEPVCRKIQVSLEEGATVLATRDTHQPDYLNTAEGRSLPVEHCIENTPGWQLNPEIARLIQGCTVIDKPSFGSFLLVEKIRELTAEEPAQLELAGLCTDICVVSNALLLKAAFPEIPIFVDSSCCAGVTPASHEAALLTMKMCQIQVY